MPESAATAQSVELLRRADDIDDILPHSAALYGFRITGTLTPAESPARHSSDKWERHVVSKAMLMTSQCAIELIMWRCRWEIALPPMVDTAHKPDDNPGGGSGYVQFSLAWALDWDQRTRDRILVEKDATPGGSDGLAASITYAVTHNQPARLTKVQMSREVLQLQVYRAVDTNHMLWYRCCAGSFRACPRRTTTPLRWSKPSRKHSPWARSLWYTALPRCAGPGRANQHQQTERSRRERAGQTRAVPERGEAQRPRSADSLV
jgi:hypothetical protein